MTRLAWFSCPSGIAGDMVLAALVDAGADADVLVAALRSLPITGWDLVFEPVVRGGLAATRAVVHAPEVATERHLTDIIAIIGAARLPERVTARAHAIFTALATAEASVHGVNLDDVHFHEVGALDAIIDVVGSMLALEQLGVDAVFCSPIAVGTGSIDTSHGVLANPGPAVTRLLHGFRIVPSDVPVELCTPTGAAVVAALAGSSISPPSHLVVSDGYGAGTRELDDRPNVVRVVIGDTDDAPTTRPLVLLETNVDDVTSEVLAGTIDLALDSGALDAWITPVLMKKGRPAHVVSVLSPVEREHQLVELLHRHLGTLGVRRLPLLRSEVDRQFVTVHVDGHAIDVKVSPYRIKAEHDDVTRVSRATGLPVIELARRAEAAAAAQAIPDH